MGKRPPTLAMKRTAAKQKGRPQYGAKRALIVRAVGPALQRYGLSGTTIEAIAKVAGLDRATVYYYFPDKSAIFREAIHDGLADLTSALEDVAGSGTTAEAKIAASMRAVMSAYEKHYPQLYIFFTNGDRSSIIDADLNTEIVASGRRYEDFVETIIRQGNAEGIFQTPLPPRVFAKAIAGMLNGTARWFAPGGTLSAEQVADGMSRMILNGVLIPGGRA